MKKSEHDFEPVKETTKKSKGLTTAAWYSGSATKVDDGKRVVPEKWRGYEEEWLAGYDGRKV